MLFRSVLKGLCPRGSPFITPGWMLEVTKIVVVKVGPEIDILCTHISPSSLYLSPSPSVSFSLCLSLCLCPSLCLCLVLSLSSHERVCLRPRHSLGRRGIRSDALLCRGDVHHVWVRLPPQGSAGGGLEVGRLQRGRRVRGPGVQRVRRRQREPPGRPLGDEPPQQRGRPHGESAPYRHAPPG